MLFERTQAEEVVRTGLFVSMVLLLGTFLGWLLGMPLPGDVIQPDTQSYWNIAKHIADAGQFSMDGANPTARRELLYPLFLSTFIKAGLAPAVLESARDAWAVILVQCGLYLAALALCVRAFSGSVETRSQTLAVLAGTVFLPISQYAFQLISEGLFIFLLAATFAALARWMKRYSLLLGALSAVLMGSMALVKSVMLLFPFIVLGYSLFSPRLRFKPTVCVVLLSLMLPAGWTVRNAMVFDTVIVSTTDGGSSLYRGNMMTYYQPPSMDDPLVPESIRREAARLGPGKADEYLAALAKEFLTEAPLKTAKHFAYKLFVLLFGLPLSTAYTALMLTKMCFWGMVLSRAVPLWRSSGAPGQLALLLAGYLAIVHTATYSTPRYMVPAMFMLMPLFVSASLSWWQKLRAAHNVQRPERV